MSISKNKILIADDEQRMLRLICDYLRKDGFFPIPAENGKIALNLYLENTDIDLVILDVMMPEMDGWSVCREIRKLTKVPIIMLTARSEEADELFGFELGADEYIKKPFSPGVLVARVKALLRRASMDESGKILEYGGLILDPERHSISEDGKTLELSPKEYDLLFYLVKNAGAALSRTRILYSVWGNDYYGDGRTVDTHIKCLRKKLKQNSDKIKTIRGFGYRFQDKA